ncbi:MAG TPA: hypothetical protein VFE62_23745, partial [Gemmataceae bacterium]|nr:hypothetical protein [Gemmataceae bacterium]
SCTMVLGMLRSLVQKNRKPLARLGEPRAARPQAEELETRTTPSVTSVLDHVGQLVTAIGNDVTRVQSDVQTVTQSLANTTNSAVSSAVTALNNDLTPVLNDLLSGADVTADLNTLLGDESQLTSALGNNVSNAIKHQVANLGHDLTALQNDLSKVTTSVSNVLTNIQNDLQSLSSALSSISINASVGADLTALNTSVSALFTASLSGQVSTSTIDTVVGDLNTLSTDLGGAAKGVIQQTINTLNTDLTQLSNQITQVTQTIQNHVSSLQSDVTTLANSIASLNAGATVTTDINNLNAAVSAVVSASGQVSTSQITAVVNDLNTLSHDLGSSITPAIRKEINNVQHDLTVIGNDVNHLTMQLVREVRMIQTQFDKLAVSVTAAINHSATVSADISVLNAAVSVIASDFTSGTISVADVNAALRAETQLAAALGGSVTPQVRQLINRLDSELRHLRDGVKQIAQVVRTTAARLEHEALRLVHNLASTATPTVAADLKTLNSALAIVATDAALGQIPAADLTAVTTALNTLITDAGTTISGTAQNLVDTIEGDLASIQSALGALLSV